MLATCYKHVAFAERAADKTLLTLRRRRLMASICNENWCAFRCICFTFFFSSLLREQDTHEFHSLLGQQEQQHSEAPFCPCQGSYSCGSCLCFADAVGFFLTAAGASTKKAPWTARTVGVTTDTLEPETAALVWVEFFWRSCYFATETNNPPGTTQ